MNVYTAVRELENKAFNNMSNLLTKEVNICDSLVRDVLSTPVLIYLTSHEGLLNI